MRKICRFNKLTMNRSDESKSIANIKIIGRTS